VRNKTFKRKEQREQTKQESRSARQLQAARRKKGAGGPFGVEIWEWKREEREERERGGGGGLKGKRRGAKMFPSLGDPTKETTLGKKKKKVCDGGQRERKALKGLPSQKLSQLTRDNRFQGRGGSPGLRASRISTQRRTRG